MIDLERVLLAAKRAAGNHFSSPESVYWCACGEQWPCPAKHLLEEDVPALVYALEEAAP